MGKAEKLMTKYIGDIYVRFLRVLYESKNQAEAGEAKNFDGG